VIAADVLSLRERAAEEAARREVELAYSNVGRQSPESKRIEVLELGVAAKEPLVQRLDEAPLHIALPARPSERERGEDPQIDASVFAGAPVEFVDDMVRLAEPQGCSEANPFADVCEC